MSARTDRRFSKSSSYLLASTALMLLVGVDRPVHAQEKLPELVVSGHKQKPRPPQHRAVARPVTPAPVLANPVETATGTLDAARSTIYAPTGTAPTTISHDTIAAMPGGTDTTVEKVVLQMPGVSQDSAASGNLHVRNEHANVQIRINGIMLPDGVSGFGTFLDTALIGNISLITGALPAQYGLRTSGVLDITTRADAFNNSG